MEFSLDLRGEEKDIIFWRKMLKGVAAMIFNLSNMIIVFLGFFYYFWLRFFCKNFLVLEFVVLFYRTGRRFDCVLEGVDLRFFKFCLLNNYF